MTQASKTASVEQSTKAGRAAVVEKPGGPLQFTSRDYRITNSRDVRIKIKACGICHSDSFAFTGHFPGLKYPIIPGHEIVGTVDEVGSEVRRLSVGDRVGVGWHAGHCHECGACRSGDFIACDKLQTPGITRDGGYAEYGIFPEEVCAIVPEKLEFSEAAPLLCAGITTYNALRHAGALPGDTVAVLGLGGLGHLGVQFAAKMGYRTVAIARGSDKAEFAGQLGAHVYIDSQKSTAVDELNKIGGAKVLLSTITSADAMTPWVEALSLNGKMVVVGADVQPLRISPIALISRRRTVTGWPSGTAKDSEDCLNFAARHGIRAMVETYPLAKAEDAYNRMMSGKARFRVVVEP